MIGVASAIAAGEAVESAISNILPCFNCNRADVWQAQRDVALVGDSMREYQFFFSKAVINMFYIQRFTKAPFEQ